MYRLCLAKCLVVVGASLLSQPLCADPVTAPPDADAAPKLVRLGLSKRAAEKLSELRVARLIELQLDGDVQLAAEALGPLDELAMRVFIDMKEAALVEVQVQVVGKRVETRTVDVSGLPWEVATRFVAIATSEALRALLVPPRKPRTRPPKPEEIADRLAGQASYELSGALEAAYLGELGTAAIGSRLGMTLHQRPFSERLSFGIFALGNASLWLEGDVAALHRFWFDPDLRLKVGAGFAFAGVGKSFDFAPQLRAHALLELDVRATPSSLIVIGLDPGISVDPARRAVGPWLGGSLAFTFEGS